jgi:hypothetical protein
MYDTERVETQRKQLGTAALFPAAIVWAGPARRPDGRRASHRLHLPTGYSADRPMLVLALTSVIWSFFEAHQRRNRIP